MTIIIVIFEYDNYNRHIEYDNYNPIKSTNHTKCDISNDVDKIYQYPLNFGLQIPTICYRIRYKAIALFFKNNWQIYFVFWLEPYEVDFEEYSR